MKNTVIRTIDLTKTFTVGTGKLDAVLSVDIEFYSKDFTVIYGPSGCGKSTLLNLITGLEPPTKGEVWVRGVNVFEMDENQRASFRARKFGIVYQMPYWIRSLNSLENVAMPLYLQGADTETAKAQAAKTIRKVGMSKFENHIPTELSGGQQQKIAVARAIVTSPWIIIADEPTGNLDSKSATEIIELFLKLNTESKRTIIMVTHNMEYLPYATRQVAMIDGKIREAKSVKRLDKILKVIKPGLTGYMKTNNGKPNESEK